MSDVQSPTQDMYSSQHGGFIPPLQVEEIKKYKPRNFRSIQNIVHPDAAAVTNEDGGSQSYIPVRFDLIDAAAMFEMAKVLHKGAEKYGENNWRRIPVEDHLNHLLMHTYAYLAGDATDEHLSHILCRATFALGVALQEEVKEDGQGIRSDAVRR